MTASEQARLATVEEHVRAENARDMDAVLGTFSASDRSGAVGGHFPTPLEPGLHTVRSPGYGAVRTQPHRRAVSATDMGITMPEQNTTNGQGEARHFAEAITTANVSTMASHKSPLTVLTQISLTYETMCWMDLVN